MNNKMTLPDGSDLTSETLQRLLERTMLDDAGDIQWPSEQQISNYVAGYDSTEERSVMTSLMSKSPALRAEVIDLVYQIESLAAPEIAEQLAGVKMESLPRVQELIAANTPRQRSMLAHVWHLAGVPAEFVVLRIPQIAIRAVTKAKPVFHVKSTLSPAEGPFWGSKVLVNSMPLLTIAIVAFSAITLTQTIRPGQVTQLVAGLDNQHDLPGDALLGGSTLGTPDPIATSFRSTKFAAINAFVRRVEFDPFERRHKFLEDYSIPVLASGYKMREIAILVRNSSGLQIGKTTISVAYQADNTTQSVELWAMILPSEKAYSFTISVDLAEQILVLPDSDISAVLVCSVHSTRDGFASSGARVVNLEGSDSEVGDS